MITSRVKQRYQITTLPQGGTRSTHDGDGVGGGGIRRIFGLKIYTLGIFWGQRSVMYILGLDKMWMFLGQSSSEFFL